MMRNDYCPWCGGDLGVAGGEWLGLLLLGLFVLLVLIGLVLIVIWAVRSGSTGGSRPGEGPPDRQPTRGDRALEEARARYARGEISREEFEEIRSTLVE